MIAQPCLQRRLGSKANIKRAAVHALLPTGMPASEIPGWKPKASPIEAFSREELPQETRAGTGATDRVDARGNGERGSVVGI